MTFKPTFIIAEIAKNVCKMSFSIKKQNKDYKIVCVAMEMREKGRIDYIYFRCREAGRKKIDFQEREMGGIWVLEITLCKRWKPKEKRKFEEGKDFLTEWALKKIKKNLRNYQTESTVFGADEKTAKLLDIEDLLFQARKMEMLQQRRYILRQLKAEGKEQRKSMLLVLDSKKWSSKDVLSILLTAKDYYEDIYVTFEEDTVGITRIAECLYEEWGLVLHVCSKEAEAKISEYDFVLFLLKEWKKQIVRKYVFFKAYIVMDTEEGIVRKVEEKCKDSCGGLYSGLLYERQHKPIPYQMAVNIAYQNPAFYTEFNVSFIAIYRV